MTFAALAGLAAGFVHVLSGPDHLAAVAPLAAGRPRVRWRAGLEWGLGHTAGVLVIGLLFLMARALIPVESLSAHSERIVGAVLVGLGVWGVWRARPGPRTHSHATPASFGMGALHGVAGGSHVVGVLPALALDTPAAAGVYLAGFGVGAILAMTSFAAIVGALAARAGRHGPATHRMLLYACSFSAVIVGGVWLVR